MPQERQTSFAGGELSPLMYGRTDLDIYRSGAKTIKNFIVTPEGVLKNRSGTQILGTFNQNTIRLYPYSVPGGADYLLAWFKTPFTGAPGSNVQITTIREDQTQPRYSLEQGGGGSADLGFTSSDLRQLRLATRTGEVLFASPDDSVALRKHYWDGSAIVWGEATNFLAPATPYLITEDDEFLDRSGRMYFEDAADLAETQPDSTHPARPWRWMYSFVVKTKLGDVVETVGRALDLYCVGSDPEDPDEFASVTAFASAPYGPSAYPAQAHRHAVYADKTRTFWFPAARGDALPGDFVNYDARLEDGEIIATRLYRGRDGQYGLITEFTSNYADDDGRVPDFANPPRRSSPPFGLANNWPRAMAYFEGRLFIGGLTSELDKVRGSSIGIFDNFDEVTLPDDTDALDFILASNDDDTLQWLVSSRNMWAFTQSGEWVIAGSGEMESITPTSISARRISRIGSSSTVPPLEVDDTVLFCQRVGTLPRALVLGQNGYIPRDLSLPSRHIFEGRSVIDWAFAEYPHKVLWVVFDDGSVASCTYVPEIGVAAWCQHDFGTGALAKAVATKPETTNETGVYFVFDRGTYNTIERLAPRELTDLRQGIFLDQSLTYNGENVAVPTFTDSHSYSETIDDFVNVSLPSHGTGTLSAGDVVRFDDPDGGAPLLLQVDSFVSATTWKMVCFDTLLPDWIWDGGAILTDTSDVDRYWVCANSVGGLHHLEGQTITAVGDAAVYTDLTVAGGEVSIGDGEYAGIIHAGVPFNSDFESLDAAQDRHQQKNVRKVYLEIESARGGSVGQTLSNLVDLRDRRVSDAYAAPQLQRQEHEIVVSGRWGKTGAVALRQSMPLPMTVIGVTREFVSGG